MRGVIVAGIGTEVGKTVVSSILCEVVRGRYWKPIASGLDDGPAESVSVARLLQGGEERVFKERYLFRRSLSPHIAASLEGVDVRVTDFTLPVCKEPLVVELAGGVMVPLNDRETNLDLINHLGLPVVVVSKHYLGSINHTLLTLAALRARGVDVLGVIFNGEELPDTERIICAQGQVAALGRLPSLRTITREEISSFSAHCGWTL